MEVGRILRSWGMRGELRVQVLTDSPHRFQRSHRLYARGAPYAIQRSRRHKSGLLLKLEGIDSPQAADALRGALLEVPESEVPSLPEDSYYHFQVLGLNVVTTQGEALGEVVDILSTGSNDVYVTRGPRGDVLVPAIADVVKSVDLERGLVTIEPLPGLL